MPKKVMALSLLCASLSLCLGCTTTSNQYLYATIPASNEIVAYREDPNSGVLTELSVSPITAGPGVESIAIHPSKKFLYAANSGEGNVSLFTIGTQGTLTEGSSRTPAGSVPTLLSMDAAGSYLFVANAGSNDISVFSIGSNGTLSQVAANFPIGMTPLNMKVSPSGGFLYVTGQGGAQGYIEVFSVSQGVLGQNPVIGSPFLAGSSPYGLAIDPAGKYLYTANKVDNTISEFAINADGSITPLQNSPIGESFSAPVSLLIDKAGKYLYVANQGSSNLAGFTIGSDGGLTLLSGSPFGSGANPSFIATDRGGKYLFVGSQGSSSSVQSFSLDTGSGALTSVQSYSVPGTATSIAITP